MVVEHEDQCAQMKRDFRFFHFLTEADIAQLQEFFKCRSYAAGEDLWREGDLSSFIAFITRGRVETKIETEFKGKQVVVGVYGPESLIGIVSLLSNETRPVTATALEPCCVLILEQECFDTLNGKNPELGNRLMKGMLFSLSMRLKQSYERLAAIF
ncbi:MAG: cyclic nucleotide-binding domain-containing protein [Desulfuromonadaceae bacterium]|nr:cyclic nucleotide-binding domain-containing protein [Desulfuromonadaceae bacterium]